MDIKSIIHRKQAVLNLARLHRKIANQRRNFFFKLSLSLSVYDNILSSKTNVIKIDRFYPLSKTCFKCGYIKQDLKLSDRQWICPVCHTKHERDKNASKTVYAEGIRILRVGASTLGVGSVRPVHQAAAVDTGIPCL